MPLKISYLLASSRRCRLLCAASLLLSLCVAVCHGEQGKSAPVPSQQPIASFTDVAEKAGLTMQDVFGGVTTKKYIIETTGTGVAIFDYDNDGWPDIFIVNGTNLEGFPESGGL